MTGRVLSSARHELQITNRRGLFWPVAKVALAFLISTATAFLAVVFIGAFA